MADFELLKELVSPNQSKIVLLVMDGLGGLPRDLNGPTELEFANTPNLDRLAVEGNLGLSQPAGAGVTPGSGPGHLGLFGYDPMKYVIGRGVLESVGIGFELTDKDVAARGNFCTVDADGVIIDRRAGRIPTSKCVELVEKLRPITLPGVEVFVEPVQDYRFCVILRGEGLDGHIADTDPQKKAPPLPAVAQTAAAAENRRVVQSMDRQSARDSEERESRQCADAARLCLVSRSAALPRSVRSCDRRAWPSIRCTRAWRGSSAWT